MKYILKQIFYIPLAVALGMGIIGCTGHSNVYESEEKEIAEKEKEAEENRKKAEQIEQAIKEEEASKQKVELDNKNLQGEQHKAWNKLQTSIDRNKYVYVGTAYFAPGVRPVCGRCHRTFDYIVSPDAFLRMQYEFSSLGGSTYSRPSGTNEPWKHTRAEFNECPYCKTNDATGAIQAKVNTNMSAITGIENTITVEKSKMQQAEDAYIENSTYAAKLKNTIDKGKKEIEERLKAEARAAEMEEQAVKAKKEKIDMVKRMLDSNFAIDVIVQVSSFSREEVEKIRLEKNKEDKTF